jgi:hypothetical protein
LKALLLGGIRGAVTEQHVCELVRHDAGDLTFRGGRLDHAAVDEHGAARQGERIDVLQVHGRERVLKGRVIQLARGGLDEAIAKALQIPLDVVVVDNRVFLAHFGCSFASNLNVLFRRVLVLRRRHLCLGVDRGRGQRNDEHQSAQQFHSRNPHELSISRNEPSSIVLCGRFDAHKR